MRYMMCATVTGGGGGGGRGTLSLQCIIANVRRRKNVKLMKVHAALIKRRKAFKTTTINQPLIWIFVIVVG